MDSTKWFVLGTIVVTVGILGILVAINKTPPPAPGEKLAEDLWQKSITNPAHQIGELGSKVTIVEFGDLQCPACALAQSPLKNYLDQNPETHFIFHHFPLSQHQHARKAARAAEATGDKFFEMVNLLFVNQSEWSGGGDFNELFGSYAENIGLDREQFLIDYENMNDDTINTGIDLGSDIGINSTPTFFVNQVRLEGVPQSVGEWEQVVNSILNPSDESANTQLEAEEVVSEVNESGEE